MKGLKNFRPLKTKKRYNRYAENQNCDLHILRFSQFRCGKSWTDQILVILSLVLLPEPLVPTISSGNAYRCPTPILTNSDSPILTVCMSIISINILADGKGGTARDRLDYKDSDNLFNEYIPSSPLIVLGFFSCLH